VGYVLQGRIVAILAVLVLAAAVASDRLAGGYWSRNPLLADLLSSIVVVIVSVAVINAALERRRRRRWSVLAQYVLFELVRTARVTWTSMMELAGLMYEDGESEVPLSAGAATLRDTPRVAAAMSALLSDSRRRKHMQEVIERLMKRSDEVLGRWAGVMLSSAAYVEVIDRHVELYSRLAWVGSLFEYFEPMDDDPRRRRLIRSTPSVQLHGDFDDVWLSENLVSIAQLAEELDKDSLQLALQIVPLDWWASRMPITTATDEGDTQTLQRPAA